MTSLDYHSIPKQRCWCSFPDPKTCIGVSQLLPKFLVKNKLMTQAGIKYFLFPKQVFTIWGNVCDALAVTQTAGKYVKANLYQNGDA